MSTRAADSEPSTERRGPIVPSRKALRWVKWIFGLTLLMGVVMAVVHFAEAQEFARIAEHAEPRWLGLAVVLQLGTYFAEAQVLRSVAKAGGSSLDLVTACRLSLTKVFVGGTFVLAAGLTQCRIPPPIVAATIVVDLVAYHAAYVLALALAIGITVMRGEATTIVLLVSLVFFVFAIGLSVIVLTLSGRRRRPLPRTLTRIRAFRIAMDSIEQADRHVARSHRLIILATAYQVGIVLCDAVTVWVLIRSVGASGSMSGVFASFMVSSLFRTIGFIPGGLGVFEAASVVTLHIVGVPPALALAATLLFRGLSFWLPMIPAVLVSRRVMSGRPARPNGP